jgi:peptidyl-prolyl cis-trans isomerase C
MERTNIRITVIGVVLGTWLGTAVAQPPNPAPGVVPPAGPVVVAVVGTEKVLLDDVDRYIREQLQVAILPDDELRRLRTEVASDMVDDLLVKRFLLQQGMKVTPEEIDRYLAAFQKNLTARGKTFTGFLKETRQTEAKLRESWADILMLNAYVKKTVSEEQLRRFYEANKDYFDGVEVKASHILVRFGSKMLPGEQAVAMRKLQSLRAELASGRMAFAAAARIHSQCPSAADGGDLGYIPRRGMFGDDRLNAAAFALKVGEISDVVETDLGLHLITVTDRKPGRPSTFEKCVDDVRDTMAEDIRRDLVEKLRKESPVKISVP